MGDYLALLEHSYTMTCDVLECEPSSRLDYLGDHIFNFTIYDSAMSELFAEKAIEVCRAISEGSTFDYIRDPENYRWYLAMCNMPFFAGRLEWGTSIRGAWWDHGDHAFTTCGLFVDDEQVCDWTFTREEWLRFIAAVIEFGTTDHGGGDGRGAQDRAGMLTAE